MSAIQQKQFTAPQFLINELTIFTNNEKKILNRCVTNYSKPTGLIKTIGYVTYRLFNALKAIVGKSDWQISNRIITSTFDPKTLVENAQNVLKMRAPTQRIEKLEVDLKIFNRFFPINTVSSELIKPINYLADVLLKAMVEVSEKGHLLSEEETQNFEENIDQFAESQGVQFAESQGVQLAAEIINFDESEQKDFKELRFQPEHTDNKEAGSLHEFDNHYGEPIRI